MRIANEHAEAASMFTTDFKSRFTPLEGIACGAQMQNRPAAVLLKGMILANMSATTLLSLDLLKKPISSAIGFVPTSPYFRC